MTKGLALGSIPVLAMAFAICGYVSLAIYKVHESSALLAQTPSMTPSSSSNAAMGDLPDVAIEAADGTHTSFAATAGTVRIATMLYAHCPGVCPATIEALRGIERELTPQQQKKLTFVLLSLDPARDSPQALRSLARQRGITSPRWLLGRTSEHDAQAFAAAVGLRFRSLSDGSFDHSTTLALIDPRGRLLARASDTGDTLEFVAAARHALARQ
jgi:protein SCO1/2